MKNNNKISAMDQLTKNLIMLMQQLNDKTPIEIKKTIRNKGNKPRKNSVAM